MISWHFLPFFLLLVSAGSRETRQDLDFERGVLWPPEHPGNREATAENTVQVSVVLPKLYKHAEVELEVAQKKAGAGILQGFRTAAKKNFLPRQLAFNITFRDSR